MAGENGAVPDEVYDLCRSLMSRARTADWWLTPAAPLGGLAPRDVWSADPERVRAYVRQLGWTTGF